MKAYVISHILAVVASFLGIISYWAGIVDSTGLLVSFALSSLLRIEGALALRRGQL